MDETATPDTEDTELSAIEQAARSFDEGKLRAALAAEGNSPALIDAIVGQMKSQYEVNTKLLARQQRQSQTEYMKGLAEQFPYAFDEDGKPLFSGTTKAEMKRSAERLHNRTAAIVGATKKTETPAAETPPKDRSAEAAAWGAPPASSEEVIRETPDATWAELSSRAVHSPAIQGDATKREIIADIKKNGPRQITRQRIGQVISRQAQRAAAAAK